VRLGAFEITEPVPELNDPHVLAVVQPLADIGNVGSMVLTRLEAQFKTTELAKLARPGDFFDFTRYRPTVYMKDERHEIKIPNTTVTCARREDGPDLLFMRILEPHMQAETYIDSIVQLISDFGVKRYGVLGAVYDMVPYTKPLLVSARASTFNLVEDLSPSKVISSEYQGLTTIMALISQYAIEKGMEALSLIVHLPGYLTSDDDYQGTVRLMEVLGSLYGFTIDQADIDKANKQKAHVAQVAGKLLNEQPKLRAILDQLEDSYISRTNQDGPDEIQLSPEIEKFLQDIDRQFRKN